MLSKNDFTMSQSPSGQVAADGTVQGGQADPGNTAASNRSRFRTLAAKRLQSL